MSASDTIKGLLALGLPTRASDFNGRVKALASTIVDDSVVSSQNAYSSSKIEARLAEITALSDEIDGEADTFAALPSAASKTGKIYSVLNSSGTIFINRKSAGLYRSDGLSWVSLSDFDAIAAQLLTNSLAIQLQSEAMDGKASVQALAAESAARLSAQSSFLTSNNPLIIAPIERISLSSTAASGTVNIDLLTAGVWFFTSPATANFTLNLRGNATNTLGSLLTVGQAISVSVLNTSGATAFYPLAIQIDGVTAAQRFVGGTPITAGSPSGIDIYSYTVIRTGATAYTVLANQSKAS